MFSMGDFAAFDPGTVHGGEGVDYNALSPADMLVLRQQYATDSRPTFEYRDYGGEADVQSDDYGSDELYGLGAIPVPSMATLISEQSAKLQAQLAAIRAGKQAPTEDLVPALMPPPAPKKPKGWAAVPWWGKLLLGVGGAVVGYKVVKAVIKPGRSAAPAGALATVASLTSSPQVAARSIG